MCWYFNKVQALVDEKILSKTQLRNKSNRIRIDTKIHGIPLRKTPRYKTGSFQNHVHKQ